MLCALLAARGSEVAGLQVGDIDWESRIVTIRRQTFLVLAGSSTSRLKDEASAASRSCSPWLRYLNVSRPTASLIPGS